MDCAACLKHLFLLLKLEIRCGCFLFASIKQISKIFVLFLLLVISLNILCSGRFLRCLIYCFCCLRRKSGELTNGLCTQIILDVKNGILESFEKYYETLIDKIGEPVEEKSNPSVDSREEIDVNFAEECSTECEKESTFEHSDEKLNPDSDEECDISMLKRLIIIERHRANAALAELAKERECSATAAEEAMVMILRLQHERSLIELESSQYKRLAEEKQIHDQQVIKSLQWLLWGYESELDDQMKLYRQQGDEQGQIEEYQNSSNSICDALEAVLYSSREPTLSSW